MAVLVEGISVIVRRDAVDATFAGGWHRFESLVANSTLCADDDIARVGFMSPTDVEAFIRLLEKGGLRFLRSGHAVDIAVVDQLRGATTPVDWLEFARLKLKDSENMVAACWLFTDERAGFGIHLPEKRMIIATPLNWRYENSLSANFKFVPSEEMSENRF